nr:MAG TPA: coiled-coil domain-containing protein [Caudoviricetes sp.]
MNSTGRNVGIRPLPCKNYRMLLWHVLFWACFLFYASYGANSNSIVPG